MNWLTSEKAFLPAITQRCVQAMKPLLTIEDVADLFWMLTRFVEQQIRQQIPNTPPRWVDYPGETLMSHPDETIVAR